MNKQRTAGVVLQYMQMALNILIQLIYTPIMLRILGMTEYGIYNLASSIIAYLSLLSLGFGASYIRFYSIYKNKNDENSIKRMNGLYLLVFSIMGVVALIGGIVLASNVSIFYNETYTAHDIEIARVLMVFLSINLAVSFPASVFVSYITAQEKFIFQKLLNMGKTVMSPAVCIVVLYLGYGSIGMVMCTTAVSLLVDLCNVIYCISKLQMKISFSQPDYRLLKDIFVFSIFIALNHVIDTINWQTDKVILGKICSGGAVAVYAIGAQINAMFTTFSTAISNVFAPRVNAIVQKNELNMDLQLTELFIKIGRIQWFILTLILTGFVFFGQFFISVWAGEGYEKSYYIALLLMTPALVPLIQNIGIEIQRAKNKHQFRSIVYLIMALLNIGISIWLAMMWGEIGAALGTAISLIVANGFIMNVYYQKKLGINIVEFWKSILKTIPGLLIPISCGICILTLFRIKSLKMFIILGMAYTTVYCISVYFLGLNRKEKALVSNVVKKVLRKC